MEIEFDLEGRDEGCAFFALYAGLRMYYEQKLIHGKKGQMSIAAAEAYGLLEDLKHQHEKEYWEATAEYEQVYG